MTREEMIAAVKECTAKLGRAPRSDEFHKQTQITVNQVRRGFRTFTRLLAASGIDRTGPGVPLNLEDLFLDWARIARKLGKLPTRTDYAAYGKHSIRPYTRRFRTWRNVPQGMKDYAIRNVLEGEWEDVMKIIGERLDKAGTFPGTSGRTFQNGRLEPHPDRPIYGRPMLGPLSFVPTNEQGVIFVFGGVAHELGFFITRIQTEFPDIEAMREVGPNQCQPTHWEAEYESRNFQAHMHPVDGCDGIVCWINNWPECPLEVIELKSVVERLAMGKQRA
jgi:HNH endonuclease